MEVTVADVKIHNIDNDEKQSFPLVIACKQNLDSDECNLESVVYRCQLCNIQFNDQSEIKAHLDKHDVFLFYCCNYCQFKCSNKEFLSIHLSTHVISELQSLLPCPKCDFKTKSTQCLKQHVDKYHQKTYWPCDYCHKAYKRKNILNKHISKEHSNRIISCKQCEINFENKDQFLKHLQKVHKKKVK